MLAPGRSFEYDGAMNIAADLSLYPLQTDYIPPIKALIERLRECPGVDVRENAVSTQLFGPHDTVFAILERESARVFSEGKAVLVIKMFCTDTVPATP